MRSVHNWSLPNRDNLMQRIHIQLSQKLKTFCSFILQFRNLGQLLDIFRKNLTFVAYLFLRLQPAKIVVKYMCKKFLLRFTFQNEHGKLLSTLFKFERQHLYHIYWSRGRQFGCKKSLLVMCKSLRLFFNTMSAGDKCFYPHRDNLMEPFTCNFLKT